MISGSDAENIKAENKIRLLLSQLNISDQIPKGFTDLAEYVKKGEDASSSIVQIRNTIVHSQLKKRITLETISKEVLFQSVQLNLWYIEVAILKILKFKGKYNNRCEMNDSEI